MNKKILQKILVAVGILAYTQNANAQGAGTYQFTALAGTYTEITGGTQLTTVQSDDNTSAAFPIGFTFNYCGTDYTQVIANANCWVSFGTTTSTTWTNSTADLNTIKPALMPFWDDVAGWVTGTNASNFTYLTTGTAPNRIFTIQYKNWQSPRNSSTAPPTFHLQVKLYESTNIVEYIYQQISATAASGAGATIGIGDNAVTPGYLSLNNASTAPVASSTAFNTAITGVPANGQIYRFKPVPPIDIKMDSVITPAAFCSNANAPVSVKVSNKGTATINDIMIDWSVDGIAQPTVNYIAPTPITNFITAPNNTAVAPLGNVFFPDNNPRVIKAWVVQANGLPDAVNTNDTVTASKASNLVGVVVNINPQDTIICDGTTITLNAGSHPNNPIYIWSNAQLTQTIQVSTAGIFGVKVQNTDGCFDSDTIIVTTHPNPLVHSIAIIDNADGSYRFNVIGAYNITSYVWDFGDGQTQPGTGTPGEVIHHYDTAGTYTVTLTLSNDCGDVTTSKIIKYGGIGPTGINDVNGIQNAFRVFPNPSKSQVTISNDNGIKIESISVFNLLGQQVYNKGNIHADKSLINISNLATGIYNVIINTEKGKIIKKLEVIH